MPFICLKAPETYRPAGMQSEIPCYSPLYSRLTIPTMNEMNASSNYRFWWGAGEDCSMVSPWGSEQPSESNELCPFNFFQGERGLDPQTYIAAHKLVAKLGEVIELKIYGLGRSYHPVHIHVNHFQIISFTGDGSPESEGTENFYQVGQWRDVVPGFQGELVVRFRPEDYTGEIVLHCHFLRHEDLGMMDTFIIVEGDYISTPSVPTASVPTALPNAVPTSISSAAPTTPSTPPPPPPKPSPLPSPSPSVVLGTGPSPMPTLVSSTPSPSLVPVTEPSNIPNAVSSTPTLSQYTCGNGTFRTVSWSAADETISCLPCPAGRFAIAGATDCTACEAGKFSSAMSAVCTPCPANFFSLGGAVTCTACFTGSAAASGSSLCTPLTPCPGGYHRVSNTAPACEVCPAGFYSLGGSSGCHMCGTGTISSAGADRCTPCSGGEFAAAGSSICRTCDSDIK